MFRNSGRRVRGTRVAIGVVKNGGAEVGHGAGGPPRIAKTVEEMHTLLQLFCCTVDVHFEAAGAKVPIHDREGDRESIWDKRERWEMFGRFGVEEVDYTGGGKTLANIRGCGLHGRVDGKGFVRRHTHGVVEERQET